MAIPQPYSERFILAHGAGQTWTFTVPTGRRAVLTDLVVLNVGAAASNCLVALAGIPVWLASIPGNYGTAHATLRQVAYAGELVQVVTGGTDMRAALSGYLLAN